MLHHNDDDPSSRRAPWAHFFWIGIALMPSLAHAQSTASASNVALLVFFMGLAIVVSFVCSVSEAALLSMTPSYVATLEPDNPKAYALLKSIKIQNLDRSIASILTLNTVAHTVGAMGAGAQAIIVFGSAWVGVFSAVFTIVILIGTEIIPKTLGTAYWRNLALPVAHYVRTINWLLTPIIYCTERITKMLTRGKSAHSFSRHEFLALAQQGEQSGQMNAMEARIIKNLLALSDIAVEDIITPRAVVAAFARNVKVRELVDVGARLNFSRYPIFDDDLDNITGFVLKSDILTAQIDSNLDAPLSDFQRPITFVFAKMRLFDLLDLMLKNRTHIAVAVGEYGEMKGLVSLEDVIEALLGLEIVDEVDRVEDMQSLARELLNVRMQKIGAEFARSSDLQ